MTDNQQEHNLVPVHTCADDTEAEVIIEYLGANGIEAISDSNIPHSVLPVSDDARVLVNREDAGRAKQLLAQRENQAES
mgnify:CR=1 FL=1